MSVSVIIPCFNEEEWINRTINNIFETAKGEIEVIVVLNKNWYPIDPRAKVIRNKENEGERLAMNDAAQIATGTHLLRIDAHCDFSPVGWDVMMEEVTGERDMTQAVLTAVDKSWNRIAGHRYERCRLLPNYEAKWEKPNKQGDVPPPITIKNMSSTGCGFMIRKEFYELIGGADESYPIMGAIGEEFSVNTWMYHGKVQTRTDVIIGHIFQTANPGYDTGGVIEARRRLVERFGPRYGEIRCQFDEFDWSEDVRPTAVQSDGPRTVTVDREDKTTTRDAGTIIREEVQHFRYVWVDDGTESDLTDNQIRLKYAPVAQFVGKKVFIRNDAGQMIEHESARIPVSGLEIAPTVGAPSPESVDGNEEK